MFDAHAHVIRDLFNGETYSSCDAPASLGDLRRAVEDVPGRDPDCGLPIIKLVWLPEERGERFGREWPLHVVWADEEPTGRIVPHTFRLPGGGTRTWDIVEYDRVVIPYFRWALVQLIPTTDESIAAWEQERYETMAVRDRAGAWILERVDALGAYPKSGWYRMIDGGVIAKHNVVCCERAERDRRVCYGYYHEPGEDVLEMVRKMWAAFLARPRLRSAAEAPHPAELAARERATVDGIKAARDAERTAGIDELTSDLAPFEHVFRGSTRFFLDPTKRFAPATAPLKATARGAAPKSPRREAS